jgi:hypothetical protein
MSGWAEGRSATAKVKQGGHNAQTICQLSIMNIIEKKPEGNCNTEVGCPQETDFARLGHGHYYTDTYIHCTILVDC